MRIVMNKSDTIGKLAGALSIFQNTVQDVYKCKKGYGYSYADLSSILEEVRPGLAANGLSVSQLCSSLNEAGIPYVGVETILMHNSGEWISSVYHMSVQVGKGMSLAQASGSVITYARRYALAAILGITQTDNDASIREDVTPLIPAPSYEDLVVLIKDKGVETNVDVWRKRFNVDTLQKLNAQQRMILSKEIGEI